jgi:hypothetical protein
VSDAVFNALVQFHKEHAVMSVIVGLIAYSLWRNIGKDSAGRRLHGKYVMVWTVAGFVSGGVIVPYVWNAELGQGAIGGCWLLMLAGWLIGMIHGAIVLLHRRYPPIDSTQNSDLKA